MTGYANLPAVKRLIELALEEDLGRGDATTDAVIGATDAAEITANIVAREPLVVFGLGVANAVFEAVDFDIAMASEVNDGAQVAAGTVVARVHGDPTPILKAERTALNFLQRLSGVATLSRKFADAVKGTSARVVDTRKTTPGYRALEKAAVLAGGCGNHRFDLGSGILIKDNHIAACPPVARAVARAKKNAPHSLRIEVEITRLDQLDPAIDAGADVVLLDNMSLADIAAAAKRAHERGVLVEVSGGITLDTVRGYAETGVDIISAGALTHSAPSVDLALDFPEP